MTTLSDRQMLDALDDGLEHAGRWPALLISLDVQPGEGRPTAGRLNDALERKGFGRVLDETVHPGQYRDAWWGAIALEIAGRPDASSKELVNILSMGLRSPLNRAAGR